MNKIFTASCWVICILLVLPFGTYAQRRQEKAAAVITITSVITDSKGQPVPDALVTSRDGAVETRTDANGRFTITATANGVLRVDAKGYEGKIIDVLQVQSAVTLDRVLFQMDEGSAVAMPFHQSMKRNIVGAVTSLNTDEIVEHDNVRLFENALRGRVPGLLNSSNIRGMGNAIFIIDGIPRDASILNMEEVEHISVLKDANASVLYGAHAANGVILVTTKRGQAYKRKINITVERGVATPYALPKYLGTADYMKLYNEARLNDKLAIAFDDNTIQNYASGTNPYRYPDVDYYSSEFLSRSRGYNKVVSEFSGGNKITQFYSNIGWINDGSLYKVGEAASAGTNRFNVRNNLNIAVSNTIKASLDVAAIFNIRENPLGNFWSDAANQHAHNYSPLIPKSLIRHDAVLSEGLNLETVRTVNGEYLLGGTSLFTNNVYGNQAMGSYRTLIDRTLQFNQGLDFDLDKFVSGLRFKTSFSLDILNSYSQSVNNQYAVYQPTWETNPSGTDSISAITRIGNDVRTGNQVLADLNFVRRLGTYGVFDYSRNINEVHSLSGNLVGYFNQFTFENVLIPQRQAHLGLRMAYNYNQRYYIDFSSAYVNGYKLAPGSKGGFSPTLGLGWVLREESGLSAGKPVNYLKLRASAGIINYEYGGSDYRLYSETFGNYRGSYSWNDGVRSLPSITLLRAANPDLTFEKMKNVNLGLEGVFFNNAIHVDANLFVTRNSGQVVRRTIYSAYLATNVPFENYEETQYYGAELGLTWSKSVGDFTIQLGANALYANSKAIKRDEVFSYDYLSRQGRSNDAMFGLESLGFFANDDEIANSPVQKFGEVQPGDIRYRDQNNDNVIDANDVVQIGHSQPRFSYGLTLNLGFKNFNLFIIGNGQQGSDAYYNGNYFWVQGDSKYSAEVLNRWTPQTAATATYPRLSSQNNNNNFRNSTQWLYKDNFFNLNRVQLTYSLPSAIAGNLFSKGVSFYLRGENLKWFSQDDERRLLRIGAEPLYQNYAIGAKVMF